MLLYHQQDLFLSDEYAHLPKKPYCSDDLSFGLQVRSYATAIKKRYIQVNPPHLRTFLLFDIDRAGGALAWEDANLPCPAWAAVNRENMHAHLAYALSAPVLTSDFKGRQAPLRYLAALEAAYSAKMEADTGYSGLITKNPQNPHWWTLRGQDYAVRGYNLEDLAGWVDLTKFKPKTGRTNLDAVGLGRNCTVFNVVSQWAYKNLREYQRGRLITPWHNAVLHQCAKVNGDFPAPMMFGEVKAIAKSISKWVWYKFDVTASDKRFSDKQRFRNNLRKNIKTDLQNWIVND